MAVGAGGGARRPRRGWLQLVVGRQGSAADGPCERHAGPGQATADDQETGVHGPSVWPTEHAVENEMYGKVGCLQQNKKRIVEQLLL